MSNTNFTYISLFSGIGGFEQALNRLGGKCLFASEIDKKARASYELLYGEEPSGDITKIQNNEIPEHDLLVGGFPCQAFSMSGKRKGFEDTRGTLFFDVARIAKEKQPKAMLLENVIGLLSHDKKRTIQTILKTLDEIGYYVDINVLKSTDFNLPQKRQRLYFVCIRKDLVSHPLDSTISYGSSIIRKGLSEDIQNYFNFSWPQPLERTLTVQDLLDTSVDNRFYLDIERVAALSPINTPKTEENPYCLGGFMTALWIKKYGTELRSRNFRQGYRLFDANHIGPTVTSSGGGLAGCAGLYLVRAEKMQGEYQTLDINFSTGTKTVLFPIEGTSENAPILDADADTYYIRRATPEEAMRLQGFSESSIQTLKNSTLSMTDFYKQAGNAVSVPVVENLASSLLQFLHTSIPPKTTQLI